MSDLYKRYPRQVFLPLGSLGKSLCDSGSLENDIVFLGRMRLHSVLGLCVEGTFRTCALKYFWDLKGACSYLRGVKKNIGRPMYKRRRLCMCLPLQLYKICRICSSIAIYINPATRDVNGFTLLGFPTRPIL